MCVCVCERERERERERRERERENGKRLESERSLCLVFYAIGLLTRASTAK